MTRASGTADEVQPDHPEQGSLYLMLQRKWKQNKTVTTEFSASSDRGGGRENNCCLQIWCLICFWVLARHLWGALNVRAWVHLACCQMVSVRNLLQSKKRTHRVPFLLPSCRTVPLDLWTMQRYDPAGQHWRISPWICFFLHSLCHKRQLWSSETVTCAVYWKILPKLGNGPSSEAQPHRIHAPKSW